MRSALLILGVGLLGTFSGGAAQSNDPGGQNDLNTLQYALTLEHLGATFYQKGQAQFNTAAFDAAGYKGAYDYFTLIAAHETAHVKTLSDTITSLGGTPVPACSYVFDSTPFASVQEYVSKALTLESTDTMAYDGSINAFTSETLVQAAATIATIEARHTSFLASLQAQSPFPAATDTPMAPMDIFRKASAFIVSCPYDANATVSSVIVRPTGVTTASTLDNAQTSSQRPTVDASSYTQGQFENDLVALNYALTLEHLEAEFYNAGQAMFTKDDFNAALGSGNGEAYYNNFNMIRDHENSHVSALETTITNRGGTPVPKCSYNFTRAMIPDVTKYVSIAQLLENTGVSAYDGAANTFTDTGLQQVAATIATVEARHAAFLNSLASPSAALNQAPTDTPLAPTDVVQAVLKTGLVTSCPYTPTGPQPISPISSTEGNGALASASVSLAALFATAAAAFAQLL